MKIFFEQLGIAWFGIVTTLVVVFVDTFFLRWTGWSLIGTKIYYILPIGSIVGGALAASGYYFGAKYTHSGPNYVLLILMVLVAGGGYVLVFWLDYTTMKIDGLPVRANISFVEFVQLRMSHTTLQYRFLRLDTGIFGYLLGFLDFVGFLIGGVCAYGILLMDKMCPSCKLYMKQTILIQKRFVTIDFAKQYVDGVEEHIACEPSPTTTDATGSEAAGPWKVRFCLLECPSCKLQLMERTIAILDGESWNTIDTCGATNLIPRGVDATRYLKQQDEIS